MDHRPFVTISNEQIYKAIIRIDKKIGNMKTQVKVNSAIIAVILLVMVAIISKVL